MTRVVVGALLLLAAAFAAAWPGLDDPRPERIELAPAWTVTVIGVQTVVETPPRPGAEPALLVQGRDEVLAVDPAGSVLARRRMGAGPITAATGDVDGDGAEDLVLALGSPMRVEVLDGGLRTLWATAPIAGATVGRVLAADLDGDGKREVVAGTPDGKLFAFTSAGKPAWKWSFPAGEGEVRALDDLRDGNVRLLVAARRSGEIVVLDGKGKVRKTTAAGGPLRRLRAFDADGDGRAEAHVGREDGHYVTVVLEGTGRTLGRLDDAVTDLRAVETDGDPRTREVVVGGKGGRVVLVHGVRTVGGTSVDGKVSALAGVDTDGDGRDELLVGTEEGGLALLDAFARPLAAMSAGGKVERIVGVASPLRDRLAVVAAGNALTAYRVRRAAAPEWYRPHAALALAVLAVCAGAFALVRAIPPPPPAPPPVDPRTAALEGAAARVRELVDRGVVSAGAAAERLRQIEREIARASSAASPPSRVSPPPPPRRQ